MIPLIYIASPSYSGSTLLTFLMNAHPDVATIGELKWGDIDLDTYCCSCGQKITECTFWSNVQSNMDDRGVEFNLLRPDTHYRHPSNYLADRILRTRVRGRVHECIRNAAMSIVPGCRKAVSRVSRTNRAIIDIVMQLQKGTVFVDSSKDPVRLKHMIDTGDYDIWVVQLVRDGRAVVNSAIKNQSQSASLAAREWFSTHREIERVGAYLGENRLMRVSYEELCQDTDAAMSRIFDWSGVKPVPVTTTFGQAEHHILGNRMRLSITGEIKHDEKWRTTLPEAALRTFEAIAGAQNRTYGYE